MTDQDKIKLGITGVLVLVFIFAAGNAVKSVGEAKKRRKKTLHSYVLIKGEGDAGTFQEKLAGEGEVKHFKKSYSVLEEETISLEATRDPFVLKPRTVSSVGLQLMGIVWDGESPQAIINDEIVEVGATLGKYRIISITKEHVKVTDGSKEIEIILYKK